MNKKVKIISISIIILSIIILSLIFVYNKIKSKIENINNTLANEKVQNEILEEIIEDSIKNLSLGRRGEYKLSIDEKSIINIITNEKLQEQVFVNNIEVISNNPTESYIVSYSYRKDKRLLSVDITGTFINTSMTRQIYKLDYNNEKITFKKIETIIIDNI